MTVLVQLFFLQPTFFFYSPYLIYHDSLFRLKYLRSGCICMRRKHAANVGKAVRIYFDEIFVHDVTKVQ